MLKDNVKCLDGEVFMAAREPCGYGCKKDCWRSEHQGQDDLEFFESRYLAFGDYDSSCSVERSNVRVIKEMAKTCGCTHLRHVYGDYGTEAIWIDTACNCDDILESLKGLETYPLISEDDHSQLEVELQDEAWDSFYRSDFVRALEKKFGCDILDYDNEKCREYCRQLEDESNTYWACESGGNMYLDLKRLMEKAEAWELKENGFQVEPKFRMSLRGELIGEFAFLEEVEKEIGDRDLWHLERFLKAEDGYEWLKLPGVTESLIDSRQPSFLGVYMDGILVEPIN